ncbi:Valine-tRNA ligase [Smittium mucronatum]|uniref:valine--tRNA ligase n=1 Tax=Smittium mucronatum TaxID=133383 RepID=A0A1R0H6U5_9FUNG|nr:Valine-tRNA ligase [Smittium mucronatum]
MLAPPPNITGALHLGHAMTASIQDAYSRWYRMKGYQVNWVPGTDHAGISTQVIVEKDLLKKSGVSRHQIGREEFLNQVWVWKNNKESVITQQQKRMGASMNWDREYFTMDSQHSDVVDHIELNSPTLIAVPNHKSKVLFGVLYKFKYKVVDYEGNQIGLIDVDTTRPETILGDAAIAVHPMDTRYKKFHGGYCIHPISNELIPIILDDVLVDMNFGTGAVKVTPCHDLNDYYCGKRHNLKSTSIFDSYVWVAARSLGEASDLAIQRLQKHGKFSKSDLQIIQDSDVLDTWFSSGLLPLSVFNSDGVSDPLLRSHKKELSQMLETGNDILFFWVARMSMLCSYFSGVPPFKTVLLHPMIRDSFGRKMSKSLGNVLDPLDVINGASLSQLKNTITSGLLNEKEKKKLIHPFVPFVSEELYEKLVNIPVFYPSIIKGVLPKSRPYIYVKNESSVMTMSYPEVSTFEIFFDLRSEKISSFVSEIIKNIRMIRQTKKIPSTDFFSFVKVKLFNESEAFVNKPIETQNISFTTSETDSFVFESELAPITDQFKSIIEYHGKIKCLSIHWYEKADENNSLLNSEDFEGLEYRVSQNVRIHIPIIPEPKRSSESIPSNKISPNEVIKFKEHLSKLTSQLEVIESKRSNPKYIENASIKSKESDEKKLSEIIRKIDRIQKKIDQAQ